MKKILCSLAAAAMLLTGARADEGMWLLPLLHQMNAQAMSDLGCRLTPDQIYSINNSSLKDAIVHFGGGCTGEIISNEGLIVTNHHCGYSYIQALSTPERNHLEDGFWAMTRSQEIPAPGLTVTFLESMTDVTDILNKVYDEALKSNKKAENAAEIAAAARTEAMAKLRKEAEADVPGSTATITSFYNENVAYLIVYKTYSDVRFVGAPPASLGKFGGETDNWEWPRHTCDFSMFRVYADKNNMPAEYSEDNVPYSPKQALKVSLKGVNDGDFSMIMGYPGRTQRFQTADQLEAMMDQYGVAVRARTARQNEMLKGMESDPVIRLKYANKYASSANGWKKWQGEALAFENLNVIGRERQKEADFTKWVNSNKKRKEKYGNALSDISEAIAQQKEDYYNLYVISESVGTIGPFSMAEEFVSAYYQVFQQSQDTIAAKAAAIQAVEEAFKDYDTQTEKNMAVAMLEFYRKEAKPENYINEFGNYATMDFKAFVDDLFAKSAFASPENFTAAKYSKTTQELISDIAVKYFQAVEEKAESFYPAILNSRPLLQQGSKAFAAGLLEWKKGEPSYPDANSTMRLTYGNVKSYSPKDGVLYKHYTTLNGVIEKEDPDNYEFRVPAKIKELYKAKDYGQYANAAGELPTCFLTNNDITGGNSGSPVLNAEGELIGLAFDGNWESMSSDVMFEPDLQRCICVDIRYVLFVMDKFGGAGHLLKEMNLVR
ncbi:MAG: S46 family peptidase [Bacteroidales bacterium]|nr:S46 family peptidase [Bacteroidales bacterium]